MKTALAQMRVVPGRPDLNIITMCRMIESAKDRGCSIIAFPELCVGGYLLSDRWTDASWCRDLMEYNKILREMSAGICLLYGNVFVDEANVNKDGRVRKYNAAYAFQNRAPLQGNPGLPLGITIKSLFPDYRVFDDDRYFHSMKDLSLEIGLPLESLYTPFKAVINGEELRIGAEICEDIWFSDYRYKGRPVNITRFLIDNGAQMIFNLSASPWTWGKDQARNRRISEAHDDSGRFVPFFYVNCTGVQNNGKNIVTFDGDSTIYDTRGKIVRRAERPFSEELIIFDDSKSSPPASRPGLGRIAAKYYAIIEGIRGMDELTGRNDTPYIIGLSGGVDSALVACLVEQAAGKERLRLFNLPSAFNSSKTIRISEHVAGELGCRLYSLSIEELVSANAGLLREFRPSELNMENIQAKVRGTSLLSNIAGILGGLMTCNGNKVEIALGYATLYGDVNGAIAPVGDLLKTEVFAMTEYMNKEIYEREVIPRSLIPDSLFRFEVPPTAELKSRQIDPMKWGYHDALVELFTDYKRLSPEDVLSWYLEGSICSKLGIPEELFRSYGLQDPEVFVNDLEWLTGSMRRAVFKRIQSPPIIVLSRGAFGYDYRESQIPAYSTQRYQELRKNILEKR